MRLFTIGYERRTQPELIAALCEAGVALLLDVRAVAASRKAGFSKKLLAAGLAEAGLDYLHLKGLGTPKAGREAARAGRVAQMQAIYERWLEEPEAQSDLSQAIALSRARPCALLCLEAAAPDCHRAMVAARIQAATGCEVVDL